MKRNWAGHEMANQPSVATERRSMVMQFPSDFRLTDEQLFEFCQLNREWRIERTAQGDLLAMPPTGSETGGRNFNLLGQLFVWTEQDGTGVGFDSSTGFTLPNGAMRSPDAAWIRSDRWFTLSLESRKRFAPICPDFVVELRSETDSLADLQDKMQEYLDNGTLLGWLLDRKGSHRRVYVYRPNQAVEELEHPAMLSGESVLPGFVLRLDKIW